MKPTSTNRNLSLCAWAMSVVALACLFVPMLFAAQQSPATASAAKTPSAATTASTATRGIPAGVKTFDTSQQAADALVSAADQFDETALAHIVPRPQHQCAIYRFGLVRRLLVDIARGTGRIENHQVVFEGSRLRSQGAVGKKRHAGAIEDEAVVSADQVGEEDRNLIAAGDGPEHFSAESAPAVRVRGS